jgi:SAM-dependent methyltransferase
MLRILMNRALGEETLRGTVIDIGGGRHPDYFDYFKKEGNPKIVAEDGSMSGIDFETDALPYEVSAVDTVILCNVLEHLYNYEHLLEEIKRILKTDGHMIGFVPWWVGYHPDPHDYFRYTHEALERIFTDAGFTYVRIRRIGSSPILANFNTLVLSMPKFVRPILYLWYAPVDWLFAKLRPDSTIRNPLGYIFVVTK